MQKFLFITFIISGFISTVTFTYAASVNPGLWELRVSTSIAGMKTGMPPQTIRQCVTEKTMVPRDVTQNGCKISNVKVNGGKVSWKMTCNNQAGNINGEGKLSYSGGSMQGQANMVIKQAGQTINMQQQYSGRRVGKCDKSKETKLPF